MCASFISRAETFTRRKKEGGEVGLVFIKLGSWVIPIHKNTKHTMRPTMFMCMVVTRDPTDLHGLYRVLRETYADNVTAKSPGSLGQTVPDTNLWQIGSLSLKINTYSVFVFKTKVKISGGSKDFNEEQGEPGGDYDEWLDEHVVSPVMRALHTESTSWKLCLLNGSHLLEDVNAKNYMRLCKELRPTHLFSQVIPPTMFTAPERRGRVCSMCMKCAQGGGSIRFDHSGKAQMFAFKSLRDMDACVKHLIEIIKIT